MVGPGAWLLIGQVHSGLILGQCCWWPRCTAGLTTGQVQRRSDGRPSAVQVLRRARCKAVVAVATHSLALDVLNAIRNHVNAARLSQAAAHQVVLPASTSQGQEGRHRRASQPSRGSIGWRRGRPGALPASQAARGISCWHTDKCIPAAAELRGCAGVLGRCDLQLCS